MRVLRFVLAVFTGTNYHWHRLHNQFTRAFMNNFPSTEEVTAQTRSDSIIASVAAEFAAHLMKDLIGPTSMFRVVRNPVRLRKLEFEHVTNAYELLICSYLYFIPTDIRDAEKHAIAEVSSHVSTSFPVRSDASPNCAVEPKDIAFSAGEEFAATMSPLMIDSDDPVYTVTFSGLFLNYMANSQKILRNVLNKRNVCKGGS